MFLTWHTKCTLCLILSPWWLKWLDADFTAHYNPCSWCFSPGKRFPVSFGSVGSVTENVVAENSSKLSRSGQKCTLLHLNPILNFLWSWRQHKRVLRWWFSFRKFKLFWNLLGNVFQYWNTNNRGCSAFWTQHLDISVTRDLKWDIMCKMSVFVC